MTHHGDHAPPVQLRRLHPQARLPRRMSAGAAGLDLFACLPEGPLRLEPGERGLVPTGWALAIPMGYEGQVRPRSGLALRQGLTVLNAPGTIDADYRGELRVLLVNFGQEPVVLSHEDRVAQLVIAAVSMCGVEEVEALPDGGERGAAGFGSTGV
ncbi:dUTP diphosphatase [Pseudenhygromyxa sp. WMMC2535]|uniref:dUTP diphosphatase n=1 Tax=Pseudenhygromyxa sp. WMMC2535 TaxID=2712867 RepID=UPI0015551EDA|nr:dUTP diphosphatase [Pseudenhygromyxa sp. WMMC2535]NVB41575.1 dUTP diphosphatase [Pseudenhygromyxa sp. WMMC2535]